MRTLEFRVKSKIVSLRVEASKIFAKFHFTLLAPILRISWNLKPSLVKVIVPPSTGDVVLFSHSVGGGQVDSLRCFRLINRSLGFEAAQATTYSYIDSHQNQIVGVIDNAEDARIFRFRGENYLYYQTLKNDKSDGLDCDIWVFDPKNQRSRKLITDFSYNGKNWVPYEFENELYFIYSFQPFIVLKCNFNESSELRCTQFWPKEYVNSIPLEWGDNFGFFGPIRGGSQLLPINDRYLIGFTHITLPVPLKFSHQMGVILLDTLRNEFHHRVLTKLRYGLLVDPFGIEINAGQISVNYSYSINRPEDKFSAVGSSTAYFDYERVLSLFDLVNFR